MSYILIEESKSTPSDKIIKRISTDIVDTILSDISEFMPETITLLGNKDDLVRDTEIVLTESLADFFAVVGKEVDEVDLIETGIENLGSSKFTQNAAKRILKSFIDDAVDEVRKDLESEFQYKVDAEVKAELRRMSE